jgi:phosphatidylglycerol:prolipoprotein diacylglycerol transferase
MIELVKFPGLGFAIELNRVAFTVWGRPIYWYGILFGLSFLAAALYIVKRVKEFGLDADRMIDVLLGTVIGGLVGARLYYVAFSWDTYQGDLMKIINVREGGLALYGGVIGAALAGYGMCRLRKVKFIPLCDLFFSGLLLAQAIGRWGNFVNVEAFGGNTTAPWGMTSDSIVRYLEWKQEALAAIGIAVDPAMPVHPTFFYESAWCLLGFVGLALFTKRRRYDGQLSLLYLSWYGLGRFFIEGLRTDSLMWGGVRVSQALAALCVVVSVALLTYFHRKIKRADDPEFMQLYVHTQEGQAILAGAFYPQKGKESQEEEAHQQDQAAKPEGEEPQSGEEPSEAAAETEEAAGQEEAPPKEEPALEEPALEEPALEEPALEEPALEEPALEEPAFHLSSQAQGEEATDKPGTGEEAEESGAAE